MALTTIDGQLCIPAGELNELTTYKALNDRARIQAITAEDACATRLMGLSRYVEQWPDSYLIESIARLVQPAYLPDLRAQIYEEDINGQVYDGVGRPQEADINPIGPASLAGKIALELCRRMAQELAGDGQAARYAPWRPTKDVTRDTHGDE